MQRADVETEAVGRRKRTTIDLGGRIALAADPVRAPPALASPPQPQSVAEGAGRRTSTASVGSEQYLSVGDSRRESGAYGFGGASRNNSARSSADAQRSSAYGFEGLGDALPRHKGSGALSNRGSVMSTGGDKYLAVDPSRRESGLYGFEEEPESPPQAPPRVVSVSRSLTFLHRRATRALPRVTALCFTLAP